MKVLLAIFALASTQLFGNVVDDLIAARKLELGDAYWLAGERYIALDKVELGKQMQEQARRIVSGYVPPSERSETAATPTVTPAPVEVNIPEVNSAELARNAAQGDRIVRYQFTKMIRGLVSEDIETIISTIATEIKGPGFEAGITRAEVRRRVQALFSENDANLLTPEMVFDVSSLTVTPVEGTDQDFLLTVKTSPSAPQFLTSRTWWGSSLNIYFVREDNLWVAKAVSN